MSTQNIPYAILSLAEALRRVNSGMAQKREAVRAISDALHAGIRQALYQKKLDILQAVIVGGTYHDEDGKSLVCEGLRTDKDFGRILRAIYVMTGGSEGHEDTRVYRPELSLLRYDSQARSLEFANRNLPHKAFVRATIDYAAFASATYEDAQPREPEKPYTFETVVAFLKRMNAQKKNWSDLDRQRLQAFADLTSGFDVKSGETRSAADIPRPVARLDGKPKLTSAPAKAANA